MPHNAKPLASIRVLDLSMFWSGPSCTCLLGELGMEVIKIESCQHPDPDRIVPQGLNYVRNDPGKDPWNRGMWHLRRNRNKLDITLNMTVPEAREIFRRLVKLSDIVVENFRMGVMERWGLGYEELKKLKPGIIMISLSSQGESGPERDYGSNAEVLAFTSGIRSITGYPDEIAGFKPTTLADPLAGTMAAGLVMAALRHHRRTGAGTHIVLAQRELLSSLIGEEFMDYAMNGRVAQPKGNAHAALAPHGCYRCRGEDSWVTIAIGEDSEWQTLCRLMAKPELAADARFADGVSRWRNQVEINTILGEWTARQDNKELALLLQRHGIAAGAVLKSPDIVQDEVLQRRQFWETIDDARPGFQSYKLHGQGFYLSKTPFRTRRRAPDLGEHNEHVFGELLGMTAAEIRGLADKGIIGTEPAPEIQETIPAIRARKSKKNSSQ